MRIAVVAISGVLLAVLASFGVVTISNSSGDQSNKPLYSYGSR